MNDDPVMRRAFEGQRLLLQGDRDGAREVYAELWADLDAAGDDDPMHRVWVAHVTADAQSDPAEQVHWDLVALKAADDAAERGGIDGVSVRTFYPSLHLNLGEGFRRLGDVRRAREHLAEAERHLRGHPADDERDGIAAAVEGLRDRIEHPPEDRMPDPHGLDDADLDLGLDVDLDLRSRPVD
ncbi:hypothetical protein AB0L40_08920 [Patulibacter sp. NPDC049589]|uniref:hypothetical protein n=1 Tax=Patulibacter sp. NPDC049589 TaxID=3154731 RepID=UPI00342268CB